MSILYKEGQPNKAGCPTLVGQAIFTGQLVTDIEKHAVGVDYRIVTCPVCGQPVSLRVAYLDPYTDPALLYVHPDCLSAQRRAEIAKESSNEVR